jgi:anti-anti-sigma regulatory factor/anti-sigma regulatory factor (Ser/Thr protein kinase)
MPPIDVETVTHSGCSVVRLDGVLDATTYRWLRDTLVKLALEQPEALVVDVDHLDITSETALTVFSSAWMRVCDWPGVAIVLVASTKSHLVMLNGAISRFVPFYTTVPQALAAAGRPPPRRRTSMDLDAHPDSPRVARVYVRRVCEDWDIPGEVVPDAIAVANELVTNAIQHTATSGEIRLERRAGTLTVAVRDGSPRPAMLHERVGDDRSGNGLRIVADIARTWGCLPHPSGGKVVWAVLSLS